MKLVIEDTKMKGMHRTMSLESVLKRVGNRLNEPDLLMNLMNEDSKSRFYTIVSLKEIVRARMRRHIWKTKDRERRKNRRAIGSQW
jgi:hypothetical protein